MKGLSEHTIFTTDTTAYQTVSIDDLKKTLDTSMITVRMGTYGLSDAWGLFCASLGLAHAETIKNRF